MQGREKGAVNAPNHNPVDACAVARAPRENRLACLAVNVIHTHTPSIADPVTFVGSLAWWAHA